MGEMDSVRVNNNLVLNLLALGVNSSIFQINFENVGGLSSPQSASFFVFTPGLGGRLMEEINNPHLIEVPIRHSTIFQVITSGAERPQ